MTGQRLGYAWLALTAALAAHVVDEALTGFLDVYNQTVVALRERFGWWPMPTFDFESWLAGLVVAIALLLALSPFAFHGRRWMAPLAYFFAGLMLINAVGHTLGTILGRTIEGVHFARPMPGFYSSPLLFIAALFLLRETNRLRAARVV